ncbi:hypothetical protein [Variovorax sp.]|uniref:hypothetical protein n=1 Tax=Variovorax sp. TaxID=1871043 RepID=UPI0025FD122C|nr:hypothetical protein [Variovorax sp.]
MKDKPLVSVVGVLQLASIATPFPMDIIFGGSYHRDKQPEGRLMNYGDRFDPVSGRTFTIQEQDALPTVPTHVEWQILRDNQIRAEEQLQGIYDANSKLAASGGGTTQAASPSKPFKPGFFSYAALTLAGGVVLLVLGIVALSSNVYADVVMPFAAKQFVDARIQSVGGFATTEEWKKFPGFRPTTQFERWQYLTQSKARYIRFHPAIVNASEPWTGMSTWLRAECSRGVEAACIDRAVGIHSGLLRHDTESIFPTSGNLASSARLAEMKARMNDGLGFWGAAWFEAYRLGGDYQINRPRPPTERPAL